MVSQAIFNDPEELKKLSSKIDHLGHTLNQYKRRIKASLAPQYSLRSILGESAPSAASSSRCAATPNWTRRC